jgi:hypothetical protein
MSTEKKKHLSYYKKNKSVFTCYCPTCAKYYSKDKKELGVSFRRIATLSVEWYKTNGKRDICKSVHQYEDWYHLYIFAIVYVYNTWKKEIVETKIVITV